MERNYGVKVWSSEQAAYLCTPHSRTGSDEKDLSALCTEAPQQARLPQAHGLRKRTPCAQRTPPPGPQEAHGEFRTPSQGHRALSKCRASGPRNTHHEGTPGSLFSCVYFHAITAGTRAGKGPTARHHSARQTTHHRTGSFRNHPGKKTASPGCSVASAAPSACTSCANDTAGPRAFHVASFVHQTAHNRTASPSHARRSSA